MATLRFGEFEWDEAKAASNLAKHGVSFEEASEVFLDESAVYFADILQPERIVALGFSKEPRFLYVVCVEKVRAGTLRLVSARAATKRERKRYERQE